MALEFGFYDSYNHDRQYNAENMNDIFEGVITDGVYAGVGDMFIIKPSYGLQVTVGTGRAWFKMTWNKNRTMAPLNLDTPDPVYDRIDTICIRVQKDILERRNDFFVYKGAILTNPQPPVLQETDTMFFLPLANVRVRANAEEIKTSDIEMLVGRGRCPFVTSILQQTDITGLFAQWQAQFEEWWTSVEEVLDKLVEGDVAAILQGIASKVDKSDKATSEDITLNSDSKWMTPAMTKEMIDDSVGEISDQIKNGVVTSFNGRNGGVIPASGDYTASQVGALPISGGTLSGNLTVSGTTTLNSTVSTGGNLTVGSASTNRNLIVNGDASTTGTLSVTSTSTFNGAVTMQSGLRLKASSSNYGQVLNFGDSDYVHISEPTNNNMEIKANKINMVTQSSNNSYFTVNGSTLESMFPSTGLSSTVIDRANTIDITGFNGLTQYGTLNISTSYEFIVVLMFNSGAGGSAVIPVSYLADSVKSNIYCYHYGVSNKYMSGVVYPVSSNVISLRFSNDFDSTSRGGWYVYGLK